MALSSKTFAQDSPGMDKITYRPPAVAGGFYPENPDSLKNVLADYLKLSDPLTIEGDIYALVVPHAGFVYSAWVAGKAYRELKGRKYDAIIILAPSHSKYFRGASVFRGEAYVTPLGECKVDEELARNIAESNEAVRLSYDGHGFRGNDAEHSIEVQIPFLQIVQPGTLIVPISIGTQDFNTTDLLVKEIVRAVKELNRKVLIVASSDLSHFHNQESALALDSSVVKAFTKFDYFKLGMNLYSQKWEACGAAPIITAMMVAEQLGANATLPLQYATSANSPYVTPNPSRVVGYFAGAVYKDDSKAFSILPEIDKESEKQILEIAKSSVIASVKKQGKVKYNFEFKPLLNDEYSAFVTLKKHGELRGCVGQIFATNPLWMSIEDAGKNAALRDTRFSPVTEKELGELEFEVTVLSRMKKILSPKEIVIGRDGVYLRTGQCSAIFLPQVAPEQNWNTTQLLQNLCRKAGLPGNAYTSPEAELYIFQALIIE